MDPIQKFALGNILSVLGAAIIVAACRNLEITEGIVLAIATVVLFFGAWMSATAKGKLPPRERNRGFSWHAAEQRDAREAADSACFEATIIAAAR